MRTHLLLNLLNEFAKNDKMRATSLINSIIQEHES